MNVFTEIIPHFHGTKPLGGSLLIRSGAHLFYPGSRGAGGPALLCVELPLDFFGLLNTDDSQLLLSDKSPPVSLQEMGPKSILLAFML